MRAPRPANELIAVVETLGRHLTPAAVPTEPLAMILWENIGYLIDEARRRTLFDAFEAAVGLDARAIAAADDATLLPLAKRGGMRPEVRVARWRTIARIALEHCGGDLDGALRSLPLGKARALLKTFPVIADPGADKVLLFSGIAARPCLESNGLRSLARLGFVIERGAYAADYRAGIEVLAASGRADRDWLVEAHQRLRDLGRTWCKRGVPNCLACPLDGTCAHAEVRAL